MSDLKRKRKEYLTVKDLQMVLDSCKLHLNEIDEVWPNIYIGNVAVAQNKAVLLKLGITHVLNAAHSKRGSIGNQGFYGNDFVYCGIPADDSTHFDLDVYFQPAADFIHRALKSPDGKVLVHCIMGMSRSSTLVLAYLMIYRHLPLKQGLQKLIQKRAIYPNRNFLALLLDLDLQLTRKKKTCNFSNQEAEPHLKTKKGSVIHKSTKTRPGGALCGRQKAEVERPNMPRGLSCLASPEGAGGRYETPSASDLQRLMWTKSWSSNHLDEVYPRIYIGDMYAAKDKRTLQAQHITHVLNAADGKFSVNTGPSFYRDTKITYHGVEAFDMPSFNLSPFFYPAANFIKNALSSPTGRVLVHCAMGLSRSSSLVLAYLMIHEHMTLVDAIKAVSDHRNISPNNGFLEQLRELDQKLNCKGSWSSFSGRT
ncbi:hypothetical protein Q5P01_023434 [Channa striata]|uniref:Dual specificity phosphatase 29 n=1 Tax=Channa striata TaxID=64152 RepID=A0AA88LNV6_CHASR|nr:hypothetical protein Q5P01_023434 [Channa striata]